ncbi:PREDICTED: OCIA domain-containing protein 1 [Nicrophorus vespilloides]|uniref:OCIA domain-containing protein 1 n=1 Tax=Nicrophorus vespilloides TaxID=110193 RepID=A0ABM1MEC5_NICVS|nr:PREDICTED: OCIA domain-containing protein 1 [Nicrophorus vespilloides]
MDRTNDENPQQAFPNPKSQRQAYQFNAEEMRVVRECNRESFLQRCLPLGTIFGVSSYMAIKQGYFRPSPRFGAAPKVTIAVVVGYFMGKFSYQQKCAEKLMQLPNSPIGEMLRQRRKGFIKETLEPGFGPGMTLAPFSDMGSADKYTDLDPRNSLDMDTSRPEYNGLDDNHRPSVDNPVSEEDMPPMQKNVTSYDELRKRNRDDYQQRRVSGYTRAPEAPRASNEMLQPPVRDEEPPQRTNKYGDALI